MHFVSHGADVREELQMEGGNSEQEYSLSRRRRAPAALEGQKLSTKEDRRTRQVFFFF